MELRVLTWNLFHGRASPPAGRNLFDQFAEALAGWEWDVALLQEVPPWWPASLSSRLSVQERTVLTSRNSVLWARRWIAERRPDLIKSNGGGSNAILVRGRRVVSHRRKRLSLLPERRWVHAVELEDAWIANLHLQGSQEQAQAAASAVRDWAGGSPLVLGGDFNLSSVSLDGFAWVGGSGVDHVLVAGLQPGPGVLVLDSGRLSDHAPVLVSVGR